MPEVDERKDIFRHSDDVCVTPWRPCPEKDRETTNNSTENVACCKYLTFGIFVHRVTR